jgi:membrane peptidoglycan carboxypeptidase
MEHVGVQNAVKTMQDMGITDYKGDLNDSVALGSLDLHLIDHTSAIGTFANGGAHVPYYTIQKVEFANTHQVFEHPQNPGMQAISPQLAYMMTDVLSNNSDRVPEFGYCNPLNLRTDGTCYGPILPSAAKTGTTNDFRDTWTVGYTSDYVLGVWVGNDDNSPMININGITGAAPIWHDAMLAAEAGHSPTSFTYPGGLVKVAQHYSDGVKTNDWYLAGQVPTAIQTAPKLTPTPKPNNKDSSKKPTPGSSDDHHNQPATVQPYCSSYSFESQPPAANNQPTDGLNPPRQDWW